MSVKPISGYMCNGEFFNNLPGAEREEKRLKHRSNISELQELLGYTESTSWLGSGGENSSFDPHGREYVLFYGAAELLIQKRDFIITFLRGIEE